MTVEVFYMSTADIQALPADDRADYPAPGWFYWYCEPGCLPDSDPFGPFQSEEQAQATANEEE